MTMILLLNVFDNEIVVKNFDNGFVVKYLYPVLDF
jgi:hypothetical protein